MPLSCRIGEGFSARPTRRYEGCPTRGEDGHDAVEWIAGQSWCDGNVGTWGASALGNVQAHTAAQHPDHLRGCVPIVYHYSEWYDQNYVGGVYARNRNEFVYGFFGGGGTNLVRLFPLYGVVWEGIEQASGDVRQIEVPMLHISGWYDHETMQTIREMEAMRCGAADGARGRQKLLIGPWSHGRIGHADQGELTYPDAEFVSSLAALEFFDHCLRGLDNGYATRPVVRYYHINDGIWRGASAWPPSTTTTADYYLTSAGGLSAEVPAVDDAVTYTADPSDPVPTLWGAVLTNDYAEQGPGDLSPIEARADVVTFTTPALAEPMSLAGQATAYLWIECDAVDTDLAVRMTEVYPDGRSMLLVDGIRRASLRNGFTAHEWLQPAPAGTVYAVDVELPPVAVTIPVGHALRISVGPSNHDRFDVNMQDGSDFSDDPDAVAQVATIQLHVGPSHPSRVSLPVADARVPTDLTSDGMTDLSDFAFFFACLAGPDVFCPDLSCQQATFYACDFDHDGDVDMRDYGTFLTQRGSGLMKLQ